MPKRKRESSEVWAQRVSAWRSSGLSGGKFARKHGLKKSTLYRWGRREEGTVFATKSAFTQVRVRPAPRPTPSSVIEVVLTGGRVLRLVGPVDAGQLRAVLEVLEAC